MAKKKSKRYEIKPEAAPSAKFVTPDAIAPDGKAGVNLKYFDSNHECLSLWGKPELKSLSKWFNKVSARTKSQITENTGTCHAHQGNGVTKQLPSGVSPDMKMYGFDVGKKQRVHGFFAGDSLYIIWLDRKHNLLS